ncbi:MAG: ABC transporter substrate-binding protein [Pirellulales bacterium]|nr:ABC transporter substrate-binding protein [Pirellulales bacterium]
MPNPQKISRRNLMKGLCISSLLGGEFLIAPSARAQTRTLYVNSYGGVWETSWRKAFFAPFTARTGIEVKAVSPVSFAKLKAQVQKKHYDWDLTNLGDVEFAVGVHENLLEKIDTSIIKKDQVPPHMIRDYGVVSYSLGTNLVYRKDKFPNGGPQSWSDFWNVKKYPGRRALFDRSFTSLAFALLADGVPTDKLYPMDIDRAFRKLDEIKPHIKVWWTQAAQSQQLIRDEVDMIAMWSARAVDLIEANVPLEIVWNGAELYDATLCVPRGNPNAAMAWEFISFVAQAEPQANLAMLLPYGPANPNARALMPEKRVRMTPAWPDNAKVAFSHDAAWLAPRMPAIRERWTQWLAI